MSSSRTVIAHPPRDLVVVTGKDAHSFLQSLVSQDLDAVADGNGAPSLLLTPQGKLDVEFTYLRVGPEAWLLCEGGFGPQLEASLRRFKIRVDVALELRADAAHLAVRGPQALRITGDGGLPVPDARFAHIAWNDGLVVRVPWPGGDGVDLVGDAATIERAEAALAGATGDAVDVLDPDGYDALRIAAGVARQGFDLDEKTIPQEAFLERDAVSFTKGCFLGQELVCRIDTRGHVNRYLRLVRTADGERPPDGAEIVVGDKTVGAITSTVADERYPAAALGYVRHEVEPPARVLVRWDGGEARAVAEALPV